MTEERRGDYINIGKELAEIRGELAVLPKIDKRLDSIEESLKGNAKPGVLTRLAVLEENEVPELTTRLSILETKIVLPLWLTGILAASVITAMVTKAFGAW